MSASALRAWTDLAEARVASRRSDVLAVVYPIGWPLQSEPAPWHPEGRVERGWPLLTSAQQIERAMATLDLFLDRAADLPDEARRQEREIVRRSQTQGLWSGQQSALARDLRLVLISDVQGEDSPPDDLKLTWYHEL